MVSNEGVVSMDVPAAADVLSKANVVLMKLAHIGETAFRKFRKEILYSLCKARDLDVTQQMTKNQYITELWNLVYTFGSRARRQDSYL